MKVNRLLTIGAIATVMAMPTKVFGAEYTWNQGDTMLGGGKVTITYDETETSQVKTLTATPAGGETLTITGDAMTFADGATIAMAVDGKLIFANDVTAEGALSLTRTDGSYFAYNWTGTNPMTDSYLTPSANIKFKEWHIDSAFSNAKGNRKTTSRGLYTCFSRPTYKASDTYGFYVLNRWDGNYTYSARMQVSFSTSGNYDYCLKMRLNTVVRAPLYDRRTTENLWNSSATSPLAQADSGWKWWYNNPNDSGVQNIIPTLSGTVHSNAIDRVVLKKIGSDQVTIGFSGNVTMSGTTDIALGVKMAVLPKSGSTFAAPYFTGEGDVEYQRNATIGVGNGMKYASFLTVTNGASVSVTHTGGFPTNGVINVWNASTLTMDVASGLNNGQSISAGRPDIRVHQGGILVMGNRCAGMAPRGSLQLFELDAAAFWLGTGKIHLDNEPKGHYVNRICLLNGSIIDGSVIRVGNDSSVAPCWMVKGNSTSTVSCHIWYFGHATNPSSTFTIDVSNVADGDDLTLNGDILLGATSAAVSSTYAGTLVKSGAGTVRLNGKYAMSRLLQIDEGAFVFGDTACAATGKNTVSAQTLKDSGTDVTEKAATSLCRDVALNGGT